MSQQTKALEQQLEHGKILIARRQLALKLSENKDFKKLILEGFMVGAAADYARESCDPALDERQQADALKLAQAPGHLKRWLSMQIQMGFKAEQDEAALEEAIRQSQLEDEEVASGDQPEQGE